MMEKILKNISLEYLKYEDFVPMDKSPFWKYVKKQTDRAIHHYYGYNSRATLVDGANLVIEVYDYINELDGYIQRVVEEVGLLSEKGNTYIQNMLEELGYDRELHFPFEGVSHNEIMDKMIAKGYFSFDYFIDAFIEDYESWERNRGGYSISYRGIRENMEKQLKVD